MRLRLRDPIRYGGRHCETGEVLEVPDGLARRLLQANRAERYSEPVPALEEVPRPPALAHIAPGVALEDPGEHRRRRRR